MEDDFQEEIKRAEHQHQLEIKIQRTYQAEEQMSDENSQYMNQLLLPDKKDEEEEQEYPKSQRTKGAIAQDKQLLLIKEWLCIEGV